MLPKKPASAPAPPPEAAPVDPNAPPSEAAPPPVDAAPLIDPMLMDDGPWELEELLIPREL